MSRPSLDEGGMGECHILSPLCDMGCGTAVRETARGEQMFKAEILGDQAQMYSFQLL